MFSREIQWALFEALADKYLRRCGECAHWMTNTCPRERNVRGMKRGPSAREYQCDEFVPKERHRKGDQP